LRIADIAPNYAGKEIITCSTFFTESVVYLYKVGNTYQKKNLIEGDNIADIDAGDFNGDGRPDLVVANLSDDDLELHTKILDIMNFLIK
jgi:hypothetical protein